MSAAKREGNVIDCDFRPRHAALEAKVEAMQNDVSQLKDDVREAFGLLRGAAEKIAEASAAMRGLQGEIAGARWGGSMVSGFIGALVATGLSAAAFFWRTKGG